MNNDIKFRVHGDDRENLVFQGFLREDSFFYC